MAQAAWHGEPPLLQPVIGMLHLPPLPGSPRYQHDPEAIHAAVLRDARVLAAGGVHALMLENFGDVPFHPAGVPAETLTHMTALLAAVRRAVPLPVGVNVLRNDGCGALAVAHAAGGSFIRVNVLCGARVTDQGLLQGIAHDLQRLRARLGAQMIAVWADVDVKHSAPLASRPLEQEVSDILHRGLADALIVSGTGTGHHPDPAKLQRIKAVADGTPVLLGSGVDAENLAAFAPHADGFIVGTSLKEGGTVEAPVDGARVKAFMEVWREVCRPAPSPRQTKRGGKRAGG